MSLPAKFVVIFLAIGLSGGVLALDQSAVTMPIELSDQVTDFNQAYKPKLVNLSNGVMIAVYGETVENNPAHYVYDLKDDLLRAARDVFVRVCDSANADCSVPANWTSPLNISNTATQTSINSDWNADSIRTAYYGDSDNPHAFAAGSHVVVTWVDNYCPSGVQCTVTYLDRNSREVPMARVMPNRM